MRKRSPKTNSEAATFSAVSKPAKCVQRIFCILEQEAALYTFFHIDESWLFRHFLITDNDLLNAVPWFLRKYSKILKLSGEKLSIEVNWISFDRLPRRPHSGRTLWILWYWD